MTIRGSRSNSSGWRPRTGPIRSSDPQSGTEGSARLARLACLRLAGGRARQVSCRAAEALRQRALGRDERRRGWERLALGCAVVRQVAGLELVEQVQDARPPFESLIEL